MVLNYICKKQCFFREKRSVFRGFIINILDVAYTAFYIICKFILKFYTIILIRMLIIIKYLNI